MRRDRGAKNVAASVRQKLRNLANRQNEDFQLILTRYASERLLYRLSISSHSNAFVLKGAMLFAAWTGQPLRPTRDVDLLGYGEPSAGRLAAIFRDICQIPVEPDGVEFDPVSVEVAAIREAQEYGGQRVCLTAYIEQAKIVVQIDIGFGDIIIPGAQEIVYPPLLDFPPPHLRAYTKESVAAEKLHAIVALGMTNSRMKDFHDLWMGIPANRITHSEGNGSAIPKDSDHLFRRKQIACSAGIGSGSAGLF